MANQQQPRPIPSEGFSIARKVMDDVVTHYLANGGPSVARQHVELVAPEIIKLYDDGKDAYREAMARISAAEKLLEQQAEERSQQQLQKLVMTMMGTMSPHKAPGLQCGGDARELPPKLSTARAMQMWRLLQQAGYIDENYQPIGLSRTEMAILITMMSNRLRIKEKWKTFEHLWGKKNLRIDYNDSMNCRKSLEFQDKLKILFADIQ